MIVSENSRFLFLLTPMDRGGGANILLRNMKRCNMFRAQRVNKAIFSFDGGGNADKYQMKTNEFRIPCIAPTDYSSNHPLL